MTRCHHLDAHIHASQYPRAGVFGDSTLLEWLQNYVFPIEASLADPSNADVAYRHCVATTLRHGTTTAAYYATIAVKSTNCLADICLEAGQRAFIGRCNMDRNDSTINAPYYRDHDCASAIRDTRETIAHIELIDPKHELLSPIITPRFAPSCTPASLCALGELAKDKSLPIQTHIAENPDEVALVKELYGQGSYAEVYDKYGLLNHTTVLGHAVHLTADERTLISKRRAKVAHCPISNSSLSSGLCPVRKLLDARIEVGLGTDVSGGWSPSVLAAAREAGAVSRLLSSVERDRPASEKRKQDPLKSRLTVVESLYLATVGGARCLGLSDKVGRFECGMEWDAQLISLGAPLHLNYSYQCCEKPEIENSPESQINEKAKDEQINRKQGGWHEGPVQLWGIETWEEKMAKWVFGGDDRNTLAVWVQGRLVHHRDEFFKGRDRTP